MTPAAATRAPTKAQELAPRVLGLLPGKPSDIARSLGRKPSDGTIRRALELLASQGYAERENGSWRRCHTVPSPGSDPQTEAAVPLDFDQESIALYARTREQLEAQETWKPSDAPLLARYIRALQDERRYRKEAEGNEFSRAKTGRVFVHPAVKLANEREASANAMASALLLTPESRRRAGRLAKADGGADELDF